MNEKDDFGFRRYHDFREYKGKFKDEAIKYLRLPSDRSIPESSKSS